MQQIPVTKRRRTRDSRERQSMLLDPLPLDPRDPDIVRAKEIEAAARAGHRHRPHQREHVCDGQVAPGVDKRGRPPGRLPRTHMCQFFLEGGRAWT
ncbi:hypothetical protein ACFVXW_10900 [Streptomyces sp. NPDC058251]|uniref:hypothetical protein n=1 Tax=Streptomyces sp. NPDC058251 TaxID=3346404 RepID=UPI0036EA10B9